MSNLTSDLRLTRSPELQAVFSELIGLAAEMARGEGLPSHFGEDHMLHQRRWYWLDQLGKANDRAKDWALRVRRIADKLPKGASKLGSPVENVR